MRAQAETACHGTVKGPEERQIPLHSHIHSVNHSLLPQGHTLLLLQCYIHTRAPHPNLLTFNTLLVYFLFGSKPPFF